MADETALAAKVVAAYLANNTVDAGDIPDLIRAAHSALVGTASQEKAPIERRLPAVSVRKSVTPGAMICLDCGGSHKILKMHLMKAHGLSVEEYRARWSLAKDYPMVAPDYAARRSQLALDSGLGRKRIPSTSAVADGGGHSPKEIPRHTYPASRWSKPRG